MSPQWAGAGWFKWAGRARVLPSAEVFQRITPNVDSLGPGRRSRPEGSSPSSSPGGEDDLFETGTCP